MEFNRYVYAVGNPVNGSDPSGLDLIGTAKIEEQDVEIVSPAILMAERHLAWRFIYQRMITRWIYRSRTFAYLTPRLPLQVLAMHYPHLWGEKG